MFYISVYSKLNTISIYLLHLIFKSVLCASHCVRFNQYVPLIISLFKSVLSASHCLQVYKSRPPSCSHSVINKWPILTDLILINSSIMMSDSTIDLCDYSGKIQVQLYFLLSSNFNFNPPPPT